MHSRRPFCFDGISSAVNELQKFFRGLICIFVIPGLWQRFNTNVAQKPKHESRCTDSIFEL